MNSTADSITPTPGAGTGVLAGFSERSENSTPERAGSCLTCRAPIQQQHVEGVLWLPKHCIDCDGRFTDDLAQRAALAACEAAAKRLARSGLPPAYRMRSKFVPSAATLADGTRVMMPDFSSPLQRTLANVPEPWTSDFTRAVNGFRMMCRGEINRGLYLFGPAGTFKTTLAAAGLAEAITDGGDGCYVAWQTLVDEVLACYGSASDLAKREVVARYVEATRLVIDDLGKDRETISEHSSLVLFQILDGRYRRERVMLTDPGSRWTVITSNRSIADLCASVADETIREPLARRMTEMLYAVSLGRPEVKP